MSRGSLLLGIIACVLGVLIVEGGLRMRAELRSHNFVGAAVPTDDTQPDPLLVAWFKPNYQSADGSESHDQFGFRLNGQPRTNPGPHPIVVLGGSTAYGWGGPDDQTIAAVLERRLRGMGDPNTVVVNAGYPGLTTLDSLLVYHAKVAQLHPSRVIVLAGLNDLYYAVDWDTNRLSWANRSYEIALRARRDTALRPVVDAIDSIALGNCFTCYALGTELSQVYQRTRLGPVLTLAEVLGQEPLNASNSRAMQLTAWSLGELARRVRADGGCLIVAWQPIAGVPAGTHNQSERDALAQVGIRAPAWQSVAPKMFTELQQDSAPVFASGAATAVDLTGAFDSIEQPVYQDDGVHYTLFAQQLLGEALARQLSQVNGC